MQRNIRAIILIAIVVILILSVSIMTKSQAIEKFPDFYGYYLLKNGECVEIPMMPTMYKTCLRGIASTWRIHGLMAEPKIVIENQRPTILIYEKDINIDDLKLGQLYYFEKLRAVDFHGTPPDPPFFKGLCGVEMESLQDLGLWTVVGTYPLRIGPVPNHPDMYRISPKEDLAPGAYAVYKSKVFTSRPLAGDFNIPLWPFRINNIEWEFPKIPPLEQSHVQISKFVIAAGWDQEDNPVEIKRNFLVSDRQIYAYIDVKDNPGGEVVEINWVRPDGSVYVQNKVSLAPTPPGKVRWVSSKFLPDNLLMPGRWRVDIKIDGKLVRAEKFNVSLPGFQ